MNAIGKFLGKHLIDPPLTRDAGLALECGSDDIDPEMGFAAWAMPRMTGMLVTLVDDLQPLGRERLGELAFDPLLHCHFGTGLRIPGIISR